jgi:hypothetical protein
MTAPMNEAPLVPPFGKFACRRCGMHKFQCSNCGLEFEGKHVCQDVERNLRDVPRAIGVIARTVKRELSRYVPGEGI